MSTRMNKRELDNVLDKAITHLQEQQLLPGMDDDAQRDELKNIVSDSIQKSGGIDFEELENLEILKTITNALVDTFTRQFDPEFSAKPGKAFDEARLDRFLELSLKQIREPDSLSSQDQKELKQLTELVMLALKQSKKQQNTPRPQPSQKSSEDMQEQVVYDGTTGVVIDKKEGQFAPASRSGESTLAIEARPGVEEEELLLGLLTALQDDNLTEYSPSRRKMQQGLTPE